MNRREFESGNHNRRGFPARLEPPIFIVLVVASLLLASCSSFPGKLYNPPARYTIGGMVSGLTGAGIVLRDNGGNDLSVGAGATSFTFTQTIVSGGSFDVTVSSQPSSPTQTCLVSNGTGVVANANITSVQVTCTTNGYTIGGTISGLTGSGLVLSDNGGNNLAVAAGATSFTFTAPVQSGGGYSVSVFSQPSNPTQTCNVTNGTGVVASANITSVQVTCTTNSYTIGGMISDLTGTGLVLRDNGGNDLAVAAGATSFTFTTPIQSGGAYSVSVFSQPSNPTQTCVVGNGAGVVANANITRVQVTCTTNSYTIGGTVSGLTGTGLVLQDNGGDNLPVAAGATSFTFTTPVQSGAAYSVSVFIPPSNPTQACVVTNGTGVVASADVTNVQVSCTGGPGLFAYVTNQGNGVFGPSITGYSMNPDGTLVPLAGSPFASGPQPHSLAADPQGKYLYVADELSFAIYTYAINGLTGDLTQVGAPAMVAPGPSTIAIHPSGAWLYAPSTSTETINGFRIDPATGVLTALPGSPFPNAGSGTSSFTLDPSGQYGFVANNASLNVSAFSVNPATGQLTANGAPIPLGGSSFESILSSRSDQPGAHLYVPGGLENVLYAFNIADDGTLSHFSPQTYPDPLDPSISALSPNGSFLYLPAFDTRMGGSIVPIDVYSIDPSTGALAEINGSPFLTQASAASVAIDPSGNFAYVPSCCLNIITGYSLNTVTGAMSPLPATFPTGEDPSEMIFVKTNQSCAVTSCATNFYQISGTISGLTGTGLVLQDNGGNALPVSAGATSFAFATAIASGGRYNVTTLSQPSSPGQTCTVSNGSGTVANANITNVQVTCTAGPSGFLYVTNQGNGTTGGSLGVYSINASGNLTPLPGPTVPANMQPFALVADPQGQWLFVTDLRSGAIFTYQINSQTGALTQSGTTIIGASDSVVIHPSGAWLYATVPDGAAGVYAFGVNGLTGALTPVLGSPFASLGSRPTNIVLDPAGQFAFVSNNASGTVTAFSINSLNGQLTPIGTVAASTAGNAAVSGFSNSLYVMDDLATVIRAFSIAGNGSLAPLSTPVFQGVSNPLMPAVSPNGQFLYVPNWVNGGTVPGGTVSVFSINQSTGILGPIVGSPFTTGMEPASVTIDSLGQFAYVANQAPNDITVFSLNSSSGAMTLSSTAAAGEGPTRIAIVVP